MILPFTFLQTQSFQEEIHNKSASELRASRQMRSGVLDLLDFIDQIDRGENQAQIAYFVE
jgi:hypothetical protein